MMFRVIWLMSVLMAVSSSPLYSRSLVQTPTSSSEQFLLISPEVQSSVYRIQPEQIQPLSQLEFPNDQAVYYYPQPAGHQEQLSSYELRQFDWLQDLWNQFTGGGETPEEVAPAETPAVTPLPENPEDYVLGPEKPIGEPDSLEAEFGNSMKSKSPEVSISNVLASPNGNPENLTGNPAGLPENPAGTPENLAGNPESPLISGVLGSPENLIALPENPEDYVLGSEKPIGEPDSLEAEFGNPMKPKSPEVSISNVGSPENQSELIDGNALPGGIPFRGVMQKIPPIDKSSEIFSNELAKTLASQPIAAPQIYMYNDKYYVISGQPAFYGKFNALKKPVSQIISLQQLAPIVRSDETNNSKPTLIAPFPLDSLRSFVKSTPSNEQNQVTEPEKEQQIQNARREEEEDKSDKKEKVQSAKVGREISDESSIAQAKPTGIAIAGNGGVASSKPIANAISGKNGLSVASPVATAVAGEFLSEDYEDKKTE